MTLTDDYTDQPKGGGWRWVFRQDESVVLDVGGTIDLGGNARSVKAPASPEPTVVPRNGGASLMPICSDSTPADPLGQVQNSTAAGKGLAPESRLTTSDIAVLVENMSRAELALWEAAIAYQRELKAGR